MAEILLSECLRVKAWDWYRGTEHLEPIIQKKQPMDKHLIHNDQEEQNDIIIYQSKDGRINVSLMTRDGNVWLSQAQIATLFATSIPNVNIHISKILNDKELDSDSVIKQYLTTASDGKQYNVNYYSIARWNAMWQMFTNAMIND